MPAASTGTLKDTALVFGTLKKVQDTFKEYVVHRTAFVNALQGYVDKMAPDTPHLEALMKSDVLAVLCCPLVQDPVPGVQSTALNCLSKLASANRVLVDGVMSCGVLDSIILALTHDSASVKCAASGVLTSIARSSTEYAAVLMSKGVVAAVLQQILTTRVDKVKEAAVKTVAALVQSSEAHANTVFEAGAADMLVTLLQAPDSSAGLCKAIAQTFANAAAASGSLAQLLVSFKALGPLTALLNSAFAPADLKAAALTCMAHVAKHSTSLASEVANTGVVSFVAAALTDKFASGLRRGAAHLLFELASKDADLAALVVQAGVPTRLALFAQQEPNSEGYLLAVSLVGQLGCYRAATAKQVIEAGAAQVLLASTSSSTDANLVGAAAWSLEQLASHGPDTAMPLIQQQALQHLMAAYKHAAADSDLRPRLKSAIKALVQHCIVTGLLEPFVSDATDSELLKAFLAALQPLLASDPKSRQQFVASGALMRLQAINAQARHDKEQELVKGINALFPADVVAYYASSSA